ncbi:HAD family hydrolase [Streptomyces sp. NPDC052036]|uniref:HAD family hydrolase n=1 Tax=unclassified Streptomyces TaxID=2593676 RepID=UPI003419749E
MITNGASDIQRAKLAATGLDQVVDGVAASGDLEIGKPDQRLFHLAADRCGHHPTGGGWSAATTGVRLRCFLDLRQEPGW